MGRLAALAATTAFVLMTLPIQTSTAQGAKPSAPRAGAVRQPGRTLFTAPGFLALPGGEQLAYENGFMLVPENRSQPNSRLIAVRFLRFRAAAGHQGADPLFMLPGGPGTLIDEPFLQARPSYIAGIRKITQTRDYIIIQQRGIQDGPYASSPTYVTAGADTSRPNSPAADRERLRAGISAGLSTWGKIVDLRGYTVPELVADVDDLRQALNHKKIILYAGSFGSQWSLAFIKTHPDRVARAVLTGLEPLDYGWDDPASLWAAMGRIGGYAGEDPKLAAALPSGGLIALYQQAVLKLEQSPALVKINDPRGGAPIEVSVTADDLRGVRYPVPGDRRDSVEAWPKFVSEIAGGDYRFLATLATRNRRQQTQSLTGELIDASLAISSSRQERLASHKEALRWIGDPNVDYENTGDLMPIAKVGDAFLANFRIAFPMVVLQGDVDLSTPMENALDQKPYLPKGKVVVIRRATHDVKEEIWKSDLIGDNGKFFEQIMSFLTDDKATGAPQALPDSVALSSFHFLPLDGPALYDRFYPAKERSR